MAEEIALDIKISTAQSATTVQELKKSLKELKNELNNVEAGSAGFHKLTKSINDTEGKLGDLNDSFQTLTGSGVERANKSFKLFTEGLTNFDLGKIKASLGGLGAAFKAIPIFLIVEGVMYLIQNFKELSSGTGILAKALKPVGDLIGWIKDGLYLLTDAIGLTNSELDKMGETVTENAKATNEALGQQTKEFDRQMQVAKAAGKSTIDIEKQKQQAIIDTNVQIVKQIEAYVRAGGELTEEQNKQLTASLEVIKDARTQQQVIELTAQKEDRDRYQKHLEEKKKITDKDFEDYKKSYKDTDDYRRQLDKEYDAWLHQLAQDDRKRLETKKEEEKAFAEEDLNTTISLLDQKYEKKRQHEQQNLDNEKAFKKQSLAVTVQAIQATQALTDLYFAHQLRQAKGNAEREKEIKKKQFQLNKAFAVAQIVLNTIQSITQAIGSNPPPLSWVLAGINSAMGTAATIAALAQKFDDGGSATGVGNIDVGGGGATASAPAIAQPNNSVTKISDEGKVITDKPMNNKVYVLETDITDSNKKISSIEETARIK